VICACRKKTRKNLVQERASELLRTDDAVRF